MITGIGAMIFDSPVMTQLDTKYAVTPDISLPYAVRLHRADHATAHRVQLERIVAQAPSGTRRDWIRRLLSPNDGSFVGAWFEILMFDWLSQIGNVIPSPMIVGDHPDFLLSVDGQMIVVECKVLRIPENNRQMQQKIIPLMEALNEIIASYLVIISPTHLARELDLESTVQAVGDWLQTEPDETLCYGDSEGNEIRFSARALDDDVVRVCSILGEASEAESVDPVIDVSRLASALAEKANQHAALRDAGYPYMIAILLEEPLLTPHSVVRAWFGEEQLTISLQ